MRFSEMRETLRGIGIVVSKRGETIRLNHFGGLEDTARYTSDLQEALTMGRDLAGPRRRNMNDAQG